MTHILRDDLTASARKRFDSLVADQLPDRLPWPAGTTFEVESEKSGGHRSVTAMLGNNEARFTADGEDFRSSVDVRWTCRIDIATGIVTASSECRDMEDDSPHSGAPWAYYDDIFYRQTRALGDLGPLFPTFVMPSEGGEKSPSLQEAYGLRQQYGSSTEIANARAMLRRMLPDIAPGT